MGFQGQLSDTVSVDFGHRRTNYKYNELGRGYIIQSLANLAIDAGESEFVVLLARAMPGGTVDVIACLANDAALIERVVRKAAA